MFGGFVATHLNHICPITSSHFIFSWKDFVKNGEKLTSETKEMEMSLCMIKKKEVLKGIKDSAKPVVKYFTCPDCTGICMKAGFGAFETGNF